MPSPRARRPTTVLVVAVLVMLVALAVIASGIALVVERDNELVQLPALLARLDEALPFDSGQELSSYVVAAGLAVAAAGVVLGLLGLGIARGLVVAYIATLLVVGALGIVAGVLRSRTTDELAQSALSILAGGLSVLFLIVLALLLGRRSRAWVLGRHEAA